MAPAEHTSPPLPTRGALAQPEPLRRQALARRAMAAQRIRSCAACRRFGFLVANHIAPVVSEPGERIRRFRSSARVAADRTGCG
jgi:hypothetical protein